MFDLKNSVILDTETTGLGGDDEVIQLGIIDAESGEVLIDQLLKPTKKIPIGASRVHGIYDKHVANAPSWPQIVEKFLQVVEKKTILIYNASYDTKIIKNTNEIHSQQGDADLLELSLMERVPKVIENAECVMLYYSKIMQEKTGARYKWRKLTVAAEEQGICLEDLTAHQAVADCEITRRVLHAMRDKALSNC